MPTPAPEPHPERHCVRAAEKKRKFDQHRKAHYQVGGLAALRAQAAAAMEEEDDEDEDDGEQKRESQSGTEAGPS